MSRSTEIDKKTKAYLIERIDLDGYEIAADSKEEKLAALESIFRAEYGWSIPRRGEIGAITEWLQGLPSAINIEFMNHEILELAKRLGSLPMDPTTAQEDKILENYFNFMANKLHQLFKSNAREVQQ